MQISTDEYIANIIRDTRADQWYMSILGQTLTNYTDMDLDKISEVMPTNEITATNFLIDKIGAYFTYIEKTKTWYVWTGKLHTPVKGSNFVKQVIKHFYYAYEKALDQIKQGVMRKINDAKQGAGTDEDTAKEQAAKLVKTFEKMFSKHYRFADRIGSSAGISAIYTQFELESSVDPNHFEESDRNFLAYENGVLDVEAARRGELFKVYDHDPSHFNTRIFNASYDDSVNLGYWDSFIESSVPDESSRKFLQKVVGAAFMGISKSRMIVNLYGPGGSGKSTFLNTILSLGQEGSGYCAELNSNAVIKQPGDHFAQNDFRGPRFLTISEPSHREEIDDDFLKKFSGDEFVNTRTLYGMFEQWRPQGIPFIASNDSLRINTRDAAIVDRIYMIEFPNGERVRSKKGVSAVGSSSDGFEQNLKNDSSRILSWIFEGMVMYVQDGFVWNPPQKVIELRQQVVQNSSVAIRWLHDYIEEGLLTIDLYNDKYHYALTCNEAYSRFAQWKSFNGEQSRLTKNYFQEDIIKQYDQELIRWDGKKMFGFIKKTDKYFKMLGEPGTVNQESDLF